MSRLLYEADHLNHLEDTYHDLQSFGVLDKDLHVVSNQDGKILRHGLNAANAWYKTDIIHSSIKGFIIGLVSGLSIAFLFSIFGGFNQEFAGIGLIFLLMLCTGFGTWIGGFIGLQSENHALKPFNNYVEDGKYLLLIDTNDNDIDALHTIMKEKHPQLKLLSDHVETTIPFEVMQTSH